MIRILTQACRSSTAALLLFVGACGSGATETASTRPNILIIVADDLAQSPLGAYGGALGLTPNLDRFAEESVVFEHAFSSSPFCTPSRQSFLTGRWPHAIGVTQIDSVLPRGVVTLGTVFRDAGYRTAAFGKMHWQLGETPGEDRGFDEIRGISEWRAGLTEEEAKTYHDHRELWRARSQRGWSQYNLGGAALELPSERQLAAWLVDQTMEFVDQEDKRPYLAFCSFNEVHEPFNFPPSFAGRVQAKDVQLPEASVDELIENAKGIYATRHARELQLGELSDEDRKGAVASYLCSVAWLDSQVGRLLQGLQDSSNTIVVFWSDHGYLLGEHGLLNKSVPYREALEAPLFLRAPGSAARRASQPVQMLDIFPTLCELTGVQAPDQLDGLSLAPILDGGKLTREVTYSEFIGIWGAIRVGSWKLVLGQKRSEGYDQLFNLADDPAENRNLIDDPEHADQVASLTEHMRQLLLQTPPDWMTPAIWGKRLRSASGVRWALGKIEPKDPH